MGWMRVHRQELIRLTGACVLLTGLPLCLVAADDAALTDAEAAAAEKRLLTSGVSTLSLRVSRDYAIAMLVRRDPDRGMGTLVRAIFRELGSGKGRKLPSPRIRDLAPVADALPLLRLYSAHGGGCALRPDVAQWLLGSDSRLRLFLDTLSSHDNWPACFKLLEDLYDHAGKTRDEFHKLILALAVVWDQPHRPLHGQMGGGQLRSVPAPRLLYDHFSALYGSRKARLRYRDLSVTALVFAVHLPVPVSEIEWARTEIKGSASSWHKKFSDIRYDVPRAVHGVYQWPHGVYTLAAIQEKGGICVDQAYFAALTARVHGIPALLFVGEGKRGPHAWFGYMKSKSGWEMDSGRYATDNYATGHAVNPQTCLPLTDHNVTFLCDRALQSSSHAQATRYGRLAVTFLDLGYHAAAGQCADLSLGLTRIYPVPWRVKLQIAQDHGDAEDVLEVLEHKAQAFRRYDDIVTAVRQQQAHVLRTLGRDRQADRLLDRNRAQVESEDRDDLARMLLHEQVRQAYRNGDHKGARREFEDLLKKQRDEGRKTVATIQAYLSLTKATDQTEEAARFLRRHLQTMMARQRGDVQAEAEFLALLLQAYKNNNDERNVRRTREKLAELITGR